MIYEYHQLYSQTMPVPKRLTLHNRQHDKKLVCASRFLRFVK
jgi:hypothetical protein